MAETEKTYTHAQVEDLISQLKASNIQLRKDVADRDSKIKDLSGQLAQLDKGKKLVLEKNEEIKRREEVLVSKENVLSEQRQKLINAKASLDAREVAVATQERSFTAIKDSLLRAAEELATKKSELFIKAEQLASELHEKRIAETEADVQALRDTARASAQAERERTIKAANEEAQRILDKAKSDTAAIESQVSELRKQNAALSADNTRLAQENDKLKAEKESLIAVTENYTKTMKDFETLKIQLVQSGKGISDFCKEIAGMDIREQDLNAKESELNERDRKLTFNEHRNQAKAAELEQKESDIDEEVKLRYPEIIADKDREIEELKKSTAQLRNSLYANTSIITQFDNLTAQFGDRNPAEILAENQKIAQELAIALDKLNNTPSYALQKTAKDLQDKEESLNERENALAQKERENLQIQDRYAQIQAENARLQYDYGNLQKDKKIVEEQLERLRSTYENPAEREDRIEAIKKPLITGNLARMKSMGLTEMEWLKGINDKIEQSELHFPPRILKAFHTALKSSEMSPLTVLAGVSGTGKSELPRLYSRFGGINFLSVPVQPNWDSQEAMLGYYNSIDNCFEPTDMLRLLAQSQNDSPEQKGLKDVMTMILLDEMNLANVELYFADFLSKLETRRGLADNEVPRIGVKIGSKMDNWPLELGRNVLWTGTMNNDETTKTLSDKVLDRGIVINFPRPNKLIGLRKGGVLAEPSALLPRTVWSSWVNDAVKFSDEQIGGYKEKVEQINEQLGKAGRALGHRVWQSIEYYMSLYPDVIAAQGEHDRTRAMDNAFEDQLVQKVMPKLRGLETRGSQDDVLEAIKAILPETLHADFKNAKEQNYGQFIWTTSDYLLRGDEPSEKPNKTSGQTIEVQSKNTQTKEKEESSEDKILAVVDMVKDNIDKKKIKSLKEIPDFLKKEREITDKKTIQEIIARIEKEY